MPFITGYGNIPISSVTPSGVGITLDSTPGDESYVYTGDNTEVGGLTYNYDPGTAIELFDSLGDSLGFVEISDLPVDFLITGIQTTNNVFAPGASFIYAVPMQWTLFSEPNVTLVSVNFPTWDGLPLTWDSSYTDELLVPFTFVWSVVATSPSDQTARFPSTTSAANFVPADYLQTNQFVFTFSGTFEEGTPPTQPVTKPVLNTTGPTITVTPPPNAETIIITTPTTTLTTSPVTPGTPVTINLPPGTPVVSIIPGPTGGSPPPLIVPIDLDVEADGMTIDVAIASSLLVIGNPSGIYTLVPNQAYDVLYERALSTTTTIQTVAIPRPYGVTSYVPESD